MGNYIDSTLTKDEQVVAEAQLHWIIYVSLGAVLTLFIAPLLQKMSTEFAVTNKRVIWKKGLIRRNTGEMNLKKIENVQVHQGVFERLFGYGNVTIVGTGGTRESFSRIANPLEFRKALQEQQDNIGA